MVSSNDSFEQEIIGTGIQISNSWRNRPANQMQGSAVCCDYADVPYICESTKIIIATA